MRDEIAFLRGVQAAFVREEDRALMEQIITKLAPSHGGEQSATVTCKKCGRIDGRHFAHCSRYGLVDVAPSSTPSVERPSLTPLSPENLASRKPLPPEVLAGAMQDKIDTGAARTRHLAAVPQDVLEKAMEFRERCDDAGFLARAILTASATATIRAPIAVNDAPEAAKRVWDDAIEAAAKVADREWVGENSLIGSRVAGAIAKAIRALSNATESRKA